MPGADGLPSVLPAAPADLRPARSSAAGRESPGAVAAARMLPRGDWGRGSMAYESGTAHDGAPERGRSAGICRGAAAALVVPCPLGIVRDRAALAARAARKAASYCAGAASPRSTSSCTARACSSRRSTSAAAPGEGIRLRSSRNQTPGDRFLLLAASTRQGVMDIAVGLDCSEERQLVGGRTDDADKGSGRPVGICWRFTGHLHQADPDARHDTEVAPACRRLGDGAAPTLPRHGTGRSLCSSLRRPQPTGEVARGCEQAVRARLHARAT